MKDKIIYDSVKHYLRDSFNDEETTKEAMLLIAAMIRIFDTVGMPYSDPKFPEVLRAFANAIDLSLEIVKRENK